MSRELIEVSEQIEEHFEMEDVEIEEEDFWQSIVNLFIWILYKLFPNWDIGLSLHSVAVRVSVSCWACRNMRANALRSHFDRVQCDTPSFQALS